MATPKAKWVTIIHVDGTVSHRIGRDGLEDLQKAVGGYIEVIPRFTTYEGLRCIAYCNEDGKMMGLEHNIKATVAWHKSMDPQGTIPVHALDVLLGPVVILRAAKSKAKS
jgi:hypothetical protein